jgi:hypothetical protein
MGTDALDGELGSFYQDLEGVVIIGVKKDQTVNIKTNIYDKEEFQAVLTTAIMMSALQNDKFSKRDVDNMH